MAIQIPILIDPSQIWVDSRGSFTESYNQRRLSEIGIDDIFVQDNEVSSCYGVIRGLHFQSPPFSQSKLIRVVSGEILDVVVDIRKYSPNYGNVYRFILTSDNRNQLYIPKGFAHGYSVLSSSAVVLYKCDNFYNSSFEGAINALDSSLNINWMVPKSKILRSVKDVKAKGFEYYCSNPVFLHKFETT